MKFWIPFILIIAFYTAGIILMKQPNIEWLKNAGIAHQEEYTYTDKDGEEHECESLIEIKGVGDVLTYKDIYLASIAFFVPAMIIGMIVFGENGDNFPTSKESLMHIVFANCILGVLLIWLTSKENIPSTIFYWLGIVSAMFLAKLND